MKTEFVPYKEALALKELGFDEPCFGHYWENLFYFQTTHSHPSTMPNSPESCLAPTFSQAFRFFREKYGYLVSPFQNENNLFFFEIGKLNTLKTEHYSKDWETYEDAEISCLVKLIEIVKNGE